MKKSLKIKYTVAIITVLCMAIFIFVSSMYTYQVLIVRMENYSYSLSELNQLRFTFDEFNSNFEEYLSNGSSDSLQQCQEYSVELNKICTSVYSEYIDDGNETQSSLVSAISTYYNTYINQVQELIETDNRSQALGLYKTKYSKNGEYISEQIDKLLNYNYQMNSKVLEDIHSKIQVIKVINNISFVILFGIIIIISFVTFNGIIKPIEKIAKQSQQIANYNFDIENIEVKTKDEIASLANMFNHMKEKLKLMFDSNIKNLQMAEEILAQIGDTDENVARLIRNQKNLGEEMFREANVDHLTHLMNQNAFIHCVNENITSIGANELCALFVIDIDNFTSINATLGDGADEVLKYSASEINNLFKDCGFIARWNRDVFVGFISGLPSEEFVHHKCKEINSVLNIHFRHKKKYHPVTASIGVSLSTNPVSAEIMFEHAEKELKSVKLAGKNGYHIERMR